MPLCSLHCRDTGKIPFLQIKPQKSLFMCCKIYFCITYEYCVCEYTALYLQKDKDTPTIFKDFEDVCYVSGFNYYHFFLSYLLQW